MVAPVETRRHERAQIILRSYQEAAVTALEQYWANNGTHPLVDFCTGSGKSLVIAEMARRSVQTGGRVLIVVHVRELIEQDVKALRQVWPDAPIGIYCSALERWDRKEGIIVASIQSVFRRPERFGHRDFLFIDEAHMVPRHEQAMYGKLTKGLRKVNPNLRVAGFTATPYRLDTGRLDEGEGRLFDEIVARYTIVDGMRDGVCVRPISKEGDEAAQIDIKNVKRAKRKDGGDFNQKGLGQAAEQEGLVEAAVAEIIERAKDRKAWLIFASSIKHAEHIVRVLRQQKIKAETVTAETAGFERKGHRIRFPRGQDSMSCRRRCLFGWIRCPRSRPRGDASPDNEHRQVHSTSWSRRSSCSREDRLSCLGLRWKCPKTWAG
jgi:DNA repair protein RadD